jgi:hypothetical protein
MRYFCFLYVFLVTSGCSNQVGYYNLPIPEKEKNSSPIVPYTLTNNQATSIDPRPSCTTLSFDKLAAFDPKLVDFNITTPLSIYLESIHNRDSLASWILQNSLHPNGQITISTTNHGDSY